MRRSKPTTLPLGTISEGTMRPKDIVPELFSVAADIRMARADRAKVCELSREWDAIPEDGYDDSDSGINLDSGLTPDEERSEIYEELCTVLERYVPEYASLGTLDGDGACIGVWLSDMEYIQQDIRDNGGIVTSNNGMRDTGDAIPRSFTGLRLDINDHGNCALYLYSRGRNVRELWSVV